MTAVITLQDHPMGTAYVAHALHKSSAGRNRHEEMGFYDGWGAVTEQFATLAGQRAQSRGR